MLVISSTGQRKGQDENQYDPAHARTPFRRDEYILVMATPFKISARTLAMSWSVGHGPSLQEGAPDGAGAVVMPKSALKRLAMSSRMACEC